jgi:adenylate kinase family enzyme
MAMELAELGQRICILGPSNSGKSTLASAIGKKRGLEVIHLDRLHHLPHTDWRPRPRDEFIALHDAAICEDRWVMEGNYWGCAPQRFRRATGVILLDVSTPTSLVRYFRRTMFERHRLGAPEGGLDRVQWEMIHFIAVTTRQSRPRWSHEFANIDLPKIRLAGLSSIKRRYRAWELDNA